MSAPRVPGHVVVVGGSLAALSTVRALRTLGHDRPVTVVGAETHRPYDRPPLSKDFLAGRIAADDLALEVPEDDLDRDDDLGPTSWLLGRRAVALDPATRAVTLDDGVVLTGDAVVVATGARARRWPSHLGGDLPGVHVLRTLDDAVALRAALVPGARLVLVGAGFVGAEIASTAALLGVDVTLVEAAPAPLAGALGTEAGAMVAGLHHANGVRLLAGAPVARLGGRDAVDSVHLADGRVLPADVVVVGTGSTPATDWLAGSGLDLDGLPGAGGVRCDAVGRTGAPGVYAVGDVASWYDPARGRHHRVEHWTDACRRPARTAEAVLGRPGADAAALPAPYFWSEQYGVRVQFAGRLAGGEQLTVEAGSADDGDVLALYRRHGRPVAVLGMNQPRLFGRARRELDRSAAPTAVPA